MTEMICYLSILSVFLIMLTSTKLILSPKFSATFIGNCGFRLTDGSKELYVDFPYKSGAFGYMEFDQKYIDSLSDAAFYLFTHGHADHFNRIVIQSKKLKITGPLWIRLNSKKYLSMDSLNKLDDWHITAYKTKHSWSIQHYSYSIKWHEKHLFFTGDAENIDILAKVDSIDVLFTNPWFLEDAIEANKLKGIKKIVLCHLRPLAKVNNKMKDRVIVASSEGMKINLDE